MGLNLIGNTNHLGRFIWVSLLWVPINSVSISGSVMVELQMGPPGAVLRPSLAVRPWQVNQVSIFFPARSTCPMADTG